MKDLISGFVLYDKIIRMVDDGCTDKEIKRMCAKEWDERSLSHKIKKFFRII